MVARGVSNRVLRDHPSERLNGARMNRRKGVPGGSRSQTSSSDEASVHGSHQDRQCGMLHFLLPGGSHPHMKRRFTAA
jgi:hypothetical protein